MGERFVTRGFVGRRTEPGPGNVADRIPPGQYLTTDFPVLSAGPTPRTPRDRWSFSIEGLVTAPITWAWNEFTALPNREWVVDISCVTKWTKLDMRWQGVSVDTLFEHVELQPAAAYVIAHCDARFCVATSVKSTVPSSKSNAASPIFFGMTEPRSRHLKRPAIIR